MSISPVSVKSFEADAPSPSPFSDKLTPKGSGAAPASDPKIQDASIQAGAQVKSTYAANDLRHYRNNHVGQIQKFFTANEFSLPRDRELVTRLMFIRDMDEQGSSEAKAALAGFAETNKTWMTYKGGDDATTLHNSIMLVDARQTAQQVQAPYFGAWPSN